MMNSLKHHRFHIPNGLAVFAALLLLISSATGLESNQEVHSSGHETTPSAQVDSVESDSIDHVVKQKRRGLKLGLLLFRRG